MPNVRTETRTITVLQFDYTELWENDRDRFYRFLLELTNKKSNVIDILDFRTYRDTNLLELYVELPKQQAIDFYHEDGMQLKHAFEESACFIDAYSLDYLHQFIEE